MDAFVLVFYFTRRYDVLSERQRRVEGSGREEMTSVFHGLGGGDSILVLVG